MSNNDGLVESLTSTGINIPWFAIGTVLLYASTCTSSRVLLIPFQTILSAAPTFTRFFVKVLYIIFAWREWFICTFASTNRIFSCSFTVSTTKWWTFASTTFTVIDTVWSTGTIGLVLCHLKYPRTWCRWKCINYLHRQVVVSTTKLFQFELVTFGKVISATDLYTV